MTTEYLTDRPSKPAFPGARHLMPLIAILLVLGGLWAHERTAPFNVFDQPFYLGIAQDEVAEGKFTNGYFYQTGNPDLPRASGMRLTPLYPSLLAAASYLDPGLRTGMACLVQGKGQNNACPHSAPLIRTLQFLLLSGVYWLIWWMAGAITGRTRAAWIALALALCTAPEVLPYVNYLMTEVTALFLVTAATAATLQAFRPPSRTPWLAAAGALAGLCALTRPAFFDLFLISTATAFALALINTNRRKLLPLVAIFFATGALVTAPWIARNDIVMGTPALTQGYGAHVLNERIAFDEMTPFEYRLSFLCWLPDGNAEAAALFGPGACHRFQWSDAPDNFYAIGNGALMQKSLAASGGWPFMFSYLMRTYIIPHPIKHAAVTLSLALRGAYISHYWGLILLPICAVQTWFALRRRDLKFLAVSLPAWTMLFFAAAVSVNQPRYNFMLIAPFAIAGAMVIERWLKNRIERN